MVEFEEGVGVNNVQEAFRASEVVPVLEVDKGFLGALGEGGGTGKLERSWTNETS